MSSNLIGQVLLDQYRVDTFIASGGMGAVYRVWDLRRNVPLAMKVLHADLTEDPSAFKRFQREANALKKLAHPNIVPFYGLHRTKHFAFMLELFIDGPSLKDILRRRKGEPLSVQETLIYLKALSAALGYAHVHGVVHCDVKPGNVMIDSGGNIYLTDFGVARHSDSTTTTLASVGTAAYMAPEQIMDRAVTAETDVYALGIMLFEMLTGQRPFRGSELGTESAGQTANEKIRYAQVRLPPPDPRSLNPSILEEIAQILVRTLSKNPEDRYPDTQALFTAMCAVAGFRPEVIPDRITPQIYPSNTSITSQTPGEYHPLSTQAGELVRDTFPSDARRIFKPLEGRGIYFAGGLIAILLLVLILALNGRGSSLGEIGQTQTAQALGMVFAAPPSSPIPTRRLTLTATIGPTSTPSPTSSPTPRGPVVVQTLIGHQGNIRSVKFNYDGSVLASSSLDQTIMLWDTSDGSLIYELRGHTAEINEIAFSPDGSLLASASADRTVRLWDVNSNSLVDELFGHSDSVTSVAFSPDGQILASSSRDGTIRLWKIADGTILRTIFSPSRSDEVKMRIFAVAFSHDGTLLASGGADNLVHIWEVSSGQRKFSFRGHLESIQNVVFSPDDQILASGSSDATVRLWKVNQEQMEPIILNHKQTDEVKVKSITFSTDGSFLASAASSDEVKIWRVSDGTMVTEIPRVDINCLDFSPKDLLLALGSIDDTLQLWDVSNISDEYEFLPSEATATEPSE